MHVRHPKRNPTLRVVAHDAAVTRRPGSALLVGVADRLGLTGRAWATETNTMADERTLRADVYVFALHTCQQPDDYDPLDLACWEFRLMTAPRIAEHGVRSASLAFLNRHAPETYRLDQLADAIERAHHAGA